MPGCLIFSSNIKRESTSKTTNNMSLSEYLITSFCHLHAGFLTAWGQEALCIWMYSTVGSGLLSSQKKGLAEYFIPLILQQSQHSALEAVPHDHIRGVEETGSSWISVLGYITWELWMRLSSNLFFFLLLQVHILFRHVVETSVFSVSSSHPSIPALSDDCCFNMYVV